MYINSQRIKYSYGSVSTSSLLQCIRIVCSRRIGCTDAKENTRNIYVCAESERARTEFSKW